MGTELQNKFDALLERGHQIQASPITEKQVNPNFQVSRRERLDCNKVSEWIHEAADSIVRTFPPGNPVRDEWDHALKRVPLLKEADHFPNLLQILEKAAGCTGSASPEPLAVSSLRDDDLADLLIRDLYDLRDLAGGCFLNLIALTYGQNNWSQVMRVANNLSTQGLLEHYIPTRGGAAAYISARGVSLVERLGKEKSLMEHLHNQAAGKGDVHFHSSVDRSNLAIHAAGVSQSLSIASETKALVATLIETLSQDKSLSESERNDAWADADTIKSELDKAKPNWKVVGALLAALGSIAAAAEYVHRIKEALGL